MALPVTNGGEGQKRANDPLPPPPPLITMVSRLHAIYRVAGPRRRLRAVSARAIHLDLVLLGLGSSRADFIDIHPASCRRRIGSAQAGDTPAVRLWPPAPPLFTAAILVLSAALERSYMA